jgi:hypothetical protein
MPEGVHAVIISRAEPPPAFTGMLAGNTLDVIGLGRAALDRGGIAGHRAAARYEQTAERDDPDPSPTLLESDGGNALEPFIVSNGNKYSAIWRQVDPADALVYNVKASLGF